MTPIYVASTQTYAVCDGVRACALTASASPYVDVR